MVSGDKAQIYTASWEVVNNMFNQKVMHALYPYVSEIVSRTQNIELGGLLVFNKVAYDLAIEIIKFHNTTDACPCYFYTNSRNPFFNPEKEQDKNNVTIIEQVILKKEYYTSYHVQCNFCDSKFKVIDGESHYRWWKWELL